MRRSFILRGEAGPHPIYPLFLLLGCGEKPGDMDADGKVEFIVRAYFYYSDTEHQDGAAYIVSSTIRGVTSLATDGILLSGGESNWFAGISVAGGGDVDGDGLDDVVIGDIMTNDYSINPNPGVAYLVLGGDLAPMSLSDADVTRRRRWSVTPAAPSLLRAMWMEREMWTGMDWRISCWETRWPRLRLASSVAVPTSFSVPRWEPSRAPGTWQAPTSCCIARSQMSGRAARLPALGISTTTAWGIS